MAKLAKCLILPTKISAYMVFEYLIKPVHQLIMSYQTYIVAFLMFLSIKQPVNMQASHAHMAIVSW